MVKKIIKGQKFFEEMTDTRGERVNIWAKAILNYEKVKTTIKLSKLIKMNDYTVLSIYTSK